jgi:uncharacterized protein YndB with AHSA1/START domain
MSDVRQGCLVIADIGGYTEYLGGVELEHSHDVLADLLGVVAEQLEVSLRVVKLEGDAVFCCRERPIDAPTLLATLESCYFAFARRQRTIDVATSCDCDACRRIPSLDLKFLAHHGSFIEHDVAGQRELVGDVAAHVLDLGARWADEQERAVARLRAEDADLTYEATLAASAAEVWNAMTDPVQQQHWRVGADRVDQHHPRASRGVGTTTHCLHGKTAITQEIIDWKPLSYFSYRERNPIGECLWTIELTPGKEPDGAPATLLVWRIKLAAGAGQRILYRAVGRRMRRILQENFDSLSHYIAAGHREVPPPANAGTSISPDA